MNQTQSKLANYDLLGLIGETADYRVYAAYCKSDRREYFLKIASTTAHNGMLEREAFVLRDLRSEMEEINRRYKRSSGSKKGLGYKRCFPELIDTFISSEQGNRRVNIIAIYGAESIKDLVPIEQWRTREHKRIDPKSSAWMMGRLLKILTFTNINGVVNEKINGGNILVNPFEHHVALFDWTQARYVNGTVPKKIIKHEIMQAAQQVVLALGGDLQTGALPQSDQLVDNRYADFLKQLMDGKISNSDHAGEKFYLLLEDIWEKEFHPFTTHNI